MGTLVGLTIAAGAGFAVWTAIRAARARTAAAAQALAQSGFTPCTAESSRLETIVQSLRQSPEFTVRKPWKRQSLNGPVYWYEVVSNPNDDNDPVVADEFLCHLRRGGRPPFVLYLKPKPMNDGLASRMLEKLIAATEPAGLHALARPQNAQAGAFLAAFGPAGASLGDLFDDQELAHLARGAQHGVFVIRGADDRCALELFGQPVRKALGNTDWQDAWSFVQHVAA